MQKLTDTDDLLGLNITLKVSPVIAIEKRVPDETHTDEDGSFLLYADAALQYTSLSRVLTGLLAGKRFTISEGLFARHVVIKNIAISGSSSNALLLRVQFTGSFNGVAAFSAIPVYNEETASIVLLHLRYDLQTTNLLLQGAKLLFASRLEKELKKMACFPVGPLLAKIQTGITASLNKEWGKGISGSGQAKDLRVLSIKALPEHLLLSVSCNGSLQIILSEIALNFKH